MRLYNSRGTHGALQHKSTNPWPCRAYMQYKEAKDKRHWGRRGKSLDRFVSHLSCQHQISVSELSMKPGTSRGWEWRQQKASLERGVLGRRWRLLARGMQFQRQKGKEAPSAQLGGGRGFVRVSSDGIEGKHRPARCYKSDTWLTGMVPSSQLSVHKSSAYTCFLPGPSLGFLQ